MNVFDVRNMMCTMLSNCVQRMPCYVMLCYIVMFEIFVKFHGNEIFFDEVVLSRFNSAPSMYSLRIITRGGSTIARYLRTVPRDLPGTTPGSIRDENIPSAKEIQRAVGTEIRE